MPAIRVGQLAAAIVLGLLGEAAAADVVRIGSEGTTGSVVAGACPELERFPVAGELRITVELVILCNAFREAGREVRFELVDQPNYSRGLVEAVAGRLDMPSQTVWSSEIEQYRDALLASPPILRPGELTVGLYTTSDRTDVLAVRTVEEVRRLVGAVPRQWVEDWRALETVGLKALVDVPYDTVWPLIAARRADFSIYTFSPEPDLGWQRRGPSGILPIRGLKLAMPGGRHFAISRATPDAEGLMADLARGVALLHERGAIARAFETMGLLDPRVRDWQVVNPLPETTETKSGCGGGSADTLAC